MLSPGYSSVSVLLTVCADVTDVTLCETGRKLTNSIDLVIEMNTQVKRKYKDRRRSS